MALDAEGVLAHVQRGLAVGGLLHGLVDEPLVDRQLVLAQQLSALQACLVRQLVPVLVALLARLLLDRVLVVALDRGTQVQSLLAGRAERQVRTLRQAVFFKSLQALCIR